MKKVLLALSIVSLFFASCKSGNVKEPEYRNITNIRLVELGILQSTAGVDLIYYNPNNFGVQLSEARGDVYLDNSFLGQFSLGDKVQVGKHSEFIVPALIKVDMIGALKNQKDLLKKKEAMIRIDGFATVKKAGFTRQIPLKFERMENIEKFRGLIVTQ
jgi:LEA14-like dessication related protein